MPSLGVALCYDFYADVRHIPMTPTLTKALAEAVDFFVVMDYDSNDAHQALAGKNIHFQPKVVPPGSSSYIYTTRDEAAAACGAAGYPRLCRKEELAGFEHCAYGWTSDWEGYWMSSAIKGCGNAGFNPTGNATRTGPAGAYCCSDTNYTPCPTCYFANAALPVVKNGVECFKTLLVPPSKLVLAFPWYGYDYTCQAGDTARDGQCHVKSARQVSLVVAKQLLANNASAPGRIWLASKQQTPWKKTTHQHLVNARALMGCHGTAISVLSNRQGATSAVYVYADVRTPVWYDVIAPTTGQLFNATFLLHQRFRRCVAQGGLRRFAEPAVEVRLR